MWPRGLHALLFLYEIFFQLFALMLQTCHKVAAPICLSVRQKEQKTVIKETFVESLPIFLINQKSQQPNKQKLTETGN